MMVLRRSHFIAVDSPAAQSLQQGEMRTKVQCGSSVRGLFALAGVAPLVEHSPLPWVAAGRFQVRTPPWCGHGPQ